MNVVLIGASASGKSTLQAMLINREPCFKKIVTYTTRPPRDGEVDGIDYHYVSVEKFTELVDSGFFAEHNSYRGWMYGTPKCDLQKDYENYVIVLTPAGYREFKKNNIEALSVYIDVDRRSRLINNLKRGDDIEEAYRRSLSDVGQYDGVKNEVDYVIDNSQYKHNEEEMLQLLLDIIKTENPNYKYQQLTFF